MSRSPLPGRDTAMEPQTNSPTTDRPCPLVFVLGPTVLAALAWICAMLGLVRP
jgi:hypothetical protein